MKLKLIVIIDNYRGTINIESEIDIRTKITVII